MSQCSQQPGVFPMSFRAALVSFLIRHTVKRQFDRIPDNIFAFRERVSASLKFSSDPPRKVIVTEVDADGVSCEWVSYGDPGDQVLLYLHGGGFVFGSPESHRGLAWRLAKASGAKVLLVDYRLAPENPFPAALEDATHCYRWLLEQGYAPDKTGIGGDSSGGGLAVTTMINLRNLGLPLPCSAILLSPWADLSGSGDSIPANEKKDPMLTTAALNNMARLYLGDRDPGAPLASPVFADLQGLPPVMVHVGSTEILLSDASRLVQNMKQGGVEAELKIWPNMPHVFQIFGGRIPESRSAINQLAMFLKTHMTGADG